MSEIAFRQLRAWALAVGDADSRFLEDMAATGVALGTRGEIPWVEAVYEKKEKKGEDVPPPTWEEEDGSPNLRDNYASARDHMEKVKQHVKADVKKGWMVRMPLATAQEQYGGDLQVASLGAVPKDCEWSDVRVVHDGTHGLLTSQYPHRSAQQDDVSAVRRC